MPRIIMTSAGDPWIPGPRELPLVVDLLEESDDEECLSDRLDATMVAACCRSGFMPLSTSAKDRTILIIKSHLQRCVLHFNALHIPRNLGKYARGLEIRIDHDFESCLRAVLRSYPDTWLTPLLCDAFRELHRSPDDGVSMHSIEVYDEGDFIAGEIGYVVGSVYASLTGFHRQNGSGTVQLVAVARILEELGFAFWDLGMDVDYKRRLGAVLYGRRDFLSLFRRHRGRRTRLVCEHRPCVELVGRRAPDGTRN